MTHDLKTSLDDLAEAEYSDAPVSTIDIGKARADGRRRVRTARLAPIGGGLAVVAACALVANGLSGTSPASPGAQATPAGSAPAAVGHDYTGTDPVHAIATFGYLPDGFRVIGYSVGSPFSNIRAQARTTEPGQSSPTNLVLTSSATEPKLPPYDTKQEATVAGSPKAYFVAYPGDVDSAPASLSLAWQTASGSWFNLGSDNQLPDAQQRALLVKVAESAHVADSAVPMPIHIEGLPANVVPNGGALDDPVVGSQSGFQAILTFTDGREGATAGTVNVSVTPSRPGGYPHGSSACKDSEGLHICVLDLPAPDGHDTLASIGGAKWLLDRITSLGADPAKWTTHVVN